MDETTTFLMLCMSLSSVLVVVIVAALYIYYRYYKGKKGKVPEEKGLTVNDGKASSDSSGGEWKTANATYYESYPACCQKSPHYNPAADKSECSDYSGCKYMGEFAGLDKKLSYDEVASRNIVSFYYAPEQKSQDKKMTWWSKNVKGKKIQIRNTQSGKILDVEPLDSCGDWDCNKCCVKNATKGGSQTLIDIEINTAKRFWGGKAQNGKIEWRYA